MQNCDCLPSQIEKEDNESERECLDRLRYMFQKDLAGQIVHFRGEPVKIKLDRDENPSSSYESTFHHITTVNKKKAKQKGGQIERREFDPERSKRILWVRRIVENHESISKCPDCGPVKAWKDDRNPNKISILLEKKRYFVVLESKNETLTLRTAFCIVYQNVLDKKLKQYEKSKNKILLGLP